jgi:hypothetical protein
MQDRATTAVQSADRVFNLPRPIALWHLASLDAPSVAVAWSLGFAWAAHVQLRWQVTLVLALATWSIYISDRLLDARAALRFRAHESLHERHYFHWRHRHIFVLLAVAAVCFGAADALFFLPSFARETGSILAVASLVYFSRVHSSRPGLRTPAVIRLLFFRKELVVGLLFAAGCILPAWSRSPGAPASNSSIWLLWIPGIYFAILVWLNCWCIAGWESVGSRSGAPQRHVAKNKVPIAAVTAAGLVAIAGLLLVVLAPGFAVRSSQLLSAGAASALMLRILDRARSRMTLLTLRICADLVMLTPLFLLLR